VRGSLPQQSETSNENAANLVDEFEERYFAICKTKCVTPEMRYRWLERLAQAHEFDYFLGLRNA
jgi:hypothetical protein